LKQYFSDPYLDTIQFDSIPENSILDPGNLETMRKTARNTVPEPCSSYFGETIHMDIVFGPEVALINIHYGLLFTDRFSRMTYLYPLHNLTSDIQKQMDIFFLYWKTPTRLVTNVYINFIGGKSREYLNSILIHINAVPSHLQDKNGLAEHHWQTMISMACNWLVTASTFWFYAVQHAAEVCNYFLFKLKDGSYTSPFELALRSKPDLRVLFKLFGLTAVKRECIGETTLNNFKSQSIPMTAVGHSLNSNGIQFYNPVNSTFISTSILTPKGFGSHPFTTSSSKNCGYTFIQSIRYLYGSLSR
jgi:hypothetical protein